MKGKHSVSTQLKKAAYHLKRGSPTILTCVGAFGVIATAALAVKATPKAVHLIQTDSKKRHNGDPYASTKMEAVKSCWTCYVPAAATGAATIVCIFGANVLNRKQQASLASAYALVSRQYRDYKNKVKEFHGKAAHERIMSSLAVERPEAPPIYNSLSGKELGFGVTDEEIRLFYDAFSERYFQATISQVLLAEYHLNRNFQLNYGEIPLTEFYSFLGLDTPEDLKNLCWYVSDYYYWIDFTHTRAMVDDGLIGEVECYIIEMDFPPTSEPLED